MTTVREMINVGQANRSALHLAEMLLQEGISFVLCTVRPGNNLFCSGSVPSERIVHRTRMIEHFQPTRSSK